MIDVDLWIKHFFSNWPVMLIGFFFFGLGVAISALEVSPAWMAQYLRENFLNTVAVLAIFNILWSTLQSIRWLKWLGLWRHD